MYEHSMIMSLTTLRGYMQLRAQLQANFISSIDPSENRMGLISRLVMSPDSTLVEEGYVATKCLTPCKRTRVGIL
jgi:hypothetical protein